MHLKRQKIPKNWPLPRKGSTYIARPNSEISQGLPLLIIVRDLLKIAKNRKEVKKALRSKNILLNKKPTFEDKNTVNLFDIITIVPSKQNYKLTLTENGKFRVEEISEKESSKKISKVVGKKKVNGNKIQINLNDGRNYISDVKCKTNDSVLIDLENSKILSCLELKEKCNVKVFAGKHAGKEGLVKELDLEKKIAEVETKDKEKMNVLIKQLIVVE